MEKEFISTLKFNEQGLIPCITQDFYTNEVLMLAYMNIEAITKTLDSKKVTYFSRSRNELWTKGETSGHFQELKSMFYDCDQDTILVKVIQTGVACHTGERTCFFNEVVNENDSSLIIDTLYNTILERYKTREEGSYTTYLFTEGVDKILKKVGEETAEVIIGAKNNSKEELIYETSDLVYHMIVLLVNQGVTINDIKSELLKRHK